MKLESLQKAVAALLSVWVMTSLAIPAHAQPSEEDPIGVGGYPFNVQGTLKVGTCDASGNPVLRNITSLEAYFRAMTSPTCDTPVGASDPTCASRATAVGAPTSLASPGVVASYVSQPQRLFFTDSDPRALIGPITYRMLVANTNVLNLSATANVTGPRVWYQVNASGFRYVAYNRPPFLATAPTSASEPSDVANGQTVQLDLHNENMASLRFRFEFQPTRVDAFGNLVLGATSGAQERIVSVRISATGVDAGLTHSVLHSFAGEPIADTGQDPAAVTGFLNTAAYALGQRQIIRAELPVTPNAGPLAVSSYTLEAAFTFEDGMRVRVVLPPLSLADFDPCDITTLPTVTIAKPRTSLSGTIVLRPLPGFTLSPYVTAYAPLIRWTSGPDFIPNTFVRMTSTGAAYYYPLVSQPEETATPATAGNVQGFSWVGFPEGEYRVLSRTETDSPRSYPTGHARLSYPGRPDYAYYHSDNPAPAANPHRALFAFPTLGFTTVTTPAADFATTGDFIVEEDAPVVLTIAGDMAYLQGNLELTGCVTNDALTSGAAEITGATADLTGGFSRGLFLGADSDYLVAAVAGPWRESRYRMKIDEPGAYTGMILIERDDSESYTLTSGLTAEGAVRTYAVSSVKVAIDTGGQLVKKPRLEIGRDTGSSSVLALFHDPADSAIELGRYYSVSSELDDDLVADPTVEIYGLSSSTAVDIAPSVLVEVNGTSVRAPRNPISHTFNGCGACIHYILDPAPGEASSITYTDDGFGPVIYDTISPQNLPAGTTSAILSGRLEDQVPITHVIIDGVEHPVTSISDELDPPTFTAFFEVPVTVAEGTNVFSITGRSLCGESTETATEVVITVPRDRCADLSYDMCMESEPG